ncbi:MAG: hypothetical protein FD137_741 [Spirochaetes bacterium]|nr:MAG: hypothetical protein FD137_741 [Spirochaetota bacterium]
MEDQKLIIRQGMNAERCDSTSEERCDFTREEASVRSSDVDVVSSLSRKTPEHSVEALDFLGFVNEKRGPRSAGLDVGHLLETGRVFDPIPEREFFIDVNNRFFRILGSATFGKDS